MVHSIGAMISYDPLLRPSISRLIGSTAGNKWIRNASLPAQTELVVHALSRKTVANPSQGKFSVYV